MYCHVVNASRFYWTLKPASKIQGMRGILGEFVLRITTGYQECLMLSLSHLQLAAGTQSLFILKFNPLRFEVKDHKYMIRMFIIDIFQTKCQNGEEV